MAVNNVERSISDRKKNDFFGSLKRFDELYKKLENNKYYRFEKDNQIVKVYVDSKFKGNYKRLVFKVNKPKETCVNNLIMLKVISDYFNKSFTKLKQEDIDKLQEDLNNDKFRKVKSNNPISLEYKKDILKTIKQFWKFYMLYCKEEYNEVVPNIVEFLQLREQPDYNKNINFITLKELLNIVNNTKPLEMKACLMVAFELGGRVIETLNIKRNNCKYNEDSKNWSIILPRLKGKSVNKSRISLDLSSKAFTNYINSVNLKDEDFVFKYSYDYFRMSLHRKGLKFLNKIITPKVFRKSCTMYLINSGASEQYIKAHLGWSPTSTAMAKYIQQSEIKKPDFLKKKIKKDVYTDIEEENIILKENQKKQGNLIQQMMDKMTHQQEMLEILMRKQKAVDLKTNEQFVTNLAEGIHSKMKYISKAKMK